MRAVSQRLVAHRTLMSGVHRTVRCGTGQSAQRGRRQALSGCSTGLSGVPTGRRQRSTATGANGRLTWLAPDIYCAVSGAPDDRKLLLSVQRLVGGVEAINTTPTGHSQVWEPKQHTKTHSAYFQELKHPSA
jgi:hypothetical protein